MRIAADDHASRRDITLFHHHLVGNPRAGRIKIHPLLAREMIDLCILANILRRKILNIMIDRENRLPRIEYLRRADLLELRNDCPGVVVRHHMLGPNRDEIAAAHDLPGTETDGVARGDFFDESLAHQLILCRQASNLGRKDARRASSEIPPLSSMPRRRRRCNRSRHVFR